MTTEQEEYLSYQIYNMTEGFEGIRLRTYDSEIGRSWKEYYNQAYVLRDEIVDLLKSYATEPNVSYDKTYDLFQTILDFEIQVIQHIRKYTVESNVNSEMFDADYNDPVFPNLIFRWKILRKKNICTKPQS